MFWAKEETENSLIRLLKSSNFTLEDVLLNEFVMHESRYGNGECVQYISSRENMKALLELSLTPKIDPDLPLKQQYRLSFVASEILTLREIDVFQNLLVTTEETRKCFMDFMNDQTPLNHLVAGFFAKIVECFLTFRFSATLSLLQETPFFDKCLQNIKLGAIECLLKSLVRIPRASDESRAMRQWMITEKIFEKIVDHMRNSPTDEDKEGLSEVYCGILRGLRDKLFMFGCKEDELHDKAMNEELIAEIADNLIVENNCTAEELEKKSSLISSSAKILESFIETNWASNSTFYFDDVGNYLVADRNMKTSLENDPIKESFQPDPERIVEGIVANRLQNIVQTILKDIEVNGSVWQPLLRLLIELSDTNFLSTHEKIAEAFRQLPFIKLIEAAKKKPRASILHSLLVKVVFILLHSVFPSGELSPAAEYLLTDGGLVKSIYDTATSFHTSGDLIACSGLRTFNQNLGDAIYRAKKSATPNPRLLIVLKNDKLWEQLEEIVVNYNGKHRPQVTPELNDTSLLSSMRNDSHGFMDSEEWSDASTKFAEMDASASNKRYFASFDASFDPNLQRFSEFDGQFEDTPDEDEFRKLCSERANSSSCSGTQLGFETSPIKWPGEQEKEEEKMVVPNVVPSTYHEETEGSEACVEQNENGEWIWPTTPPLGETELVTQTGPRPSSNWVDDCVPDFSYLDTASSKEGDMWADFSSFSTTSLSTATTSTTTKNVDFGWPGSNTHLQGEALDWPLNSSHDSKPSDPNTVGLAASISHSEDSSEA